MSLIGEAPQGMQLFHHELLDIKLVDDMFGIDTFRQQLVYIKMNTQGVLIFQVADASCCSDGQLLVGSADRHVTEAQLIIGTTHLRLQVERQREFLQHGSKGLGDILQHHPAFDLRR